MKLGYMRISTGDQTTASQRAALDAAGVDRIYEDVASGARRYEDRLELARLLDSAREGDVLVVFKLDRVSRSLPDLRRLIDELDRRGIGFVSLSEHLDLSAPSPTKTLMLTLLGAFAEFERAIIRERTLAGLRASNKRPGPKPKLDRNAIVQARRLLQAGSTTAEVCQALGVGRSTLFRALAKAD